MNIIEYGKENQQTIMLLHGGGLSWWNYKEAAELLKDRYHVILPILDGHAGSSRNFTSIEDNAEALLHYIDEHCGGHIFLIGGLSLGGQVLVEMLAQRPSFCEYAIIESACVIPSRLTNALIKPMFDMSFGLIKKKWFAKLQFKSQKIKSALFANYFEDTCKISKQDMITFLKANTSYSCKEEISRTTAQVTVVVGAREQSNMISSARKLHQMIPGSKLIIKDKLYHGEYSINHPAEYAEYINSL